MDTYLFNMNNECPGLHNMNITNWYSLVQIHDHQFNTIKKRPTISTPELIYSKVNSKFSWPINQVTTLDFSSKIRENANVAWCNLNLKQSRPIISAPLLSPKQQMVMFNLTLKLSQPINQHLRSYPTKTWTAHVYKLKLKFRWPMKSAPQVSPNEYQYTNSTAMIGLKLNSPGRPNEKKHI